MKFIFLFIFLTTINVFSAQHDYIIANDVAANVRADINSALSAIVSNNSGTTAPSTTYAFQMWMDTSGGTPILKMRNAANSAWITLGDGSLSNLGLLPLTGGSISGSLTFTNTDHIRLTAGTTAQRPGSPASGSIRYNTDNKNFEGYHDSAWAAFERENANSDYVSNLSIAATVSANALTINIKTADGSTPTAGNPVKVAFRSQTEASGDLTLVKGTAAASITVSSGSTLGTANGVQHRLWVYALNSSGTIEVGVSQVLFDETVRVTTTAEGGAGAADSNSVMYSTSARTGVAFRVIGTILITEATAGTWSTAPTNITTGTFEKLQKYETIFASYSHTAGQNITTASATTVDYAVKDVDTKNAVTTGSAWKFTAPSAGTYLVCAGILFNSAAWTAGNAYWLDLYKNGSVANNFYYNTIETTRTDFESTSKPCLRIILAKGDYIHTSASHNRGSTTSLSTTANYNNIQISKVSE